MASHQRSASVDQSRTSSFQNDGSEAAPTSSSYKINTFCFNDGSAHQIARPSKMQDAPYHHSSNMTSLAGRPSNPSPVSDPDVAAVLNALARDDETHATAHSDITDGRPHGGPRTEGRQGQGSIARQGPQQQPAMGPRPLHAASYGMQPPHVSMNRPEQLAGGGMTDGSLVSQGRMQYAVTLAPYGQMPPVHPAQAATSSHFAQLRMMGADHLMGMHSSVLGHPQLGVYGSLLASGMAAHVHPGMQHMGAAQAGLYAHAQCQDATGPRKRPREALAEGPGGHSSTPSHSVLSHSSPAAASMGGTSISTSHTGNTGSGSSTSTGTSAAQLSEEPIRHTSQRGGSGSAFSSSTGGTTHDSPRSRCAGEDVTGCDSRDNTRGESLSADGSRGSSGSGTGGQQDSADGSNSGGSAEEGRVSGSTSSSVSDDGKGEGQATAQGGGQGEGNTRTAAGPPHFYGPHTVHTAGMHASPWQIPGYNNNPPLAAFFGMGPGVAGTQGGHGQQAQGGYMSAQGAQNAHFQAMAMQYMQAAAMGHLGPGVTPFAAMQMAMIATGMMQGGGQVGGGSMGPPPVHTHQHADGSSSSRHSASPGTHGLYHIESGAGADPGEGDDDDEDADLDEELPEGVEFYIPSDDADEGSGPSKGKKSKKGKMDEREKAKVTEFIARLTSGSLIVARGDLARALQDYVNPTRPREFYEKLVSRRGMNQDFTHLLAPRRPRKRRLPGEKGVSPGGEQRFFTHRRKLSGTEGPASVTGSHGSNSASVTGGAGGASGGGANGGSSGQGAASAQNTGSHNQHTTVASLPDSSVQAALTVRQQAAAFQAGILYAQSHGLTSQAQGTSAAHASAASSSS